MVWGMHLDIFGDNIVIRNVPDCYETPSFKTLCKFKFRTSIIRFAAGSLISSFLSDLCHFNKGRFKRSWINYDDDVDDGVINFDDILGESIN